MAEPAPRGSRVVQRRPSAWIPESRGSREWRRGGCSPGRGQCLPLVTVVGRQHSGSGCHRAAGVSWDVWATERLQGEYPARADGMAAGLGCRVEPAWGAPSSTQARGSLALRLRLRSRSPPTRLRAFKCDPQEASLSSRDLAPTATTRKATDKGGVSCPRPSVDEADGSRRAVEESSRGTEEMPRTHARGWC